MTKNFCLDSLMKEEKSKCKDKIPYLAKLRNAVIIEYIDNNLMLFLENYHFDLIKIKIRWEETMFDNITLKDCWSYAYRLIYRVFEFGKTKNDICIICSFYTITNDRSNIDYGMPIVCVLLIHKESYFTLTDELMNFIRSIPEFKPIFTSPTSIRDHCGTFKHMFNGCNNSYLVRMVPDGSVVHWYSSIEKFKLFMRTLRQKSNGRNFRLNCKEIL